MKLVSIYSFFISYFFKKKNYLTEPIPNLLWGHFFFLLHTQVKKILWDHYPHNNICGSAAGGGGL